MINPTVLDPNLGLRTVVSGLTTPTTMAFLGANDFFVLEKSTGKIDHVSNGVVAPTFFNFGSGPVANLPVNFNSERGLLGIALSPNIANDHNVYLYWTESSTGALSGNVGDVPLLGNRVDRFIWNPASSTLTFDKNIIRLHAFQNDGNGGNPNQMAGNHNGGVIKFGPDGKLYVVIGDNGRRGWMQNLINGPNGPGQTDENNGPVRGGPAPDDAHLTGVMLRLNPDGSTPDDNPFTAISTTLQAAALTGPDTAGTGSFTAFLGQAMDKLTVDITWQNLGGPLLAGGGFITLGGSPNGPAIFAVDALPRGSTSGELTTTLTADNFIAEPAFGINTLADALNAVRSGRAAFNLYTRQFPGGALGGTITTLDPSITSNLHKVFAYGIRNSFGFDFDPLTGKLWLEENGDISFDKISIVDAGSNNGWIQSSAPLLNFDGTLDDVALADFKRIELQARNGAPQQTRWPSSNIADSAQEALNRLVLLPGAHYNAPVFSVRAEFPPAGLGFLSSSALGAQYQDALFVGEARDFAYDGALLLFHPTADRNGIDFMGDPNVRAADGVFLNDTAFDLKGDTTFLFGMGFGIGTDILTGPDGNLYVVSETKGAVYEIYRKDAAAGFQAQNLVADDAAAAAKADPAGGTPAVIDPSLKNPWGVALNSTSPFWISDQRTGVSTLYSGDVKGSPIAKNPLVVTDPARTDLLVGSRATNSVLRFNQVTGAFIDAFIATSSVLRFNQVTGAFIDAFIPSGSGGLSGPGGGFEDPNLPPGSPYKAFNVENLGGTLYVAHDKVVTVNGVTDREHDGVVADDRMADALAAGTRRVDALDQVFASWA